MLVLPRSSAPSLRAAAVRARSAGPAGGQPTGRAHPTSVQLTSDRAFASIATVSRPRTSFTRLSRYRPGLMTAVFASVSVFRALWLSVAGMAELILSPPPLLPGCQAWSLPSPARPARPLSVITRHRLKKDRRLHPRTCLRTRNPRRRQRHRRARSRLRRST